MVSEPRRGRAGRGPQPGRAERRRRCARVRRLRRARRTRRAHTGARRVRHEPAARRRVRLVRRPGRDERDRRGLPQPPPPHRAPALGRLVRLVLVGSRRRAQRRVRAGRGVRRGAVPDRRRSRTSSSAGGCRGIGEIVLDPAAPGHASQGVDAPRDGRDRFRAPRRPLGDAGARAPTAPARRSTSGSGSKPAPPLPSVWSGASLARRPVLATAFAAGTSR